MFFSRDLGRFSWNFPNEAVDFLAISDAFFRSPDVWGSTDVVGVRPTAGTLVFLALAMLRSLCSSFLATLSLFSSMAFSKGSWSWPSLYSITQFFSASALAFL